MHHFILGEKTRVDHHDGNSLNNRRGNLRIATQSQNRANIGKPSGNHSSRYKGVAWNKGKSATGGGWRAQIGFDYKKIHLGCFKDEVDAATAYNFKAFELFGEFARFNHPFPEEPSHE
jgi:hypothetical protein